MRHTFIYVSLCIILMTTACGNSGNNASLPKDLQQAVAAVSDSLKPNKLSKSMFTAAHPNGQPSDYVAYYFSSLGAAEWPASTLEFSEEEMRMMGMNYLPQSVSLVANTPDMDKGKQVVMSANNETGMVTLSVYENPQQTPIAIKEYPLPKVKPAPGVKELYQSNKMTGM